MKEFKDYTITDDKSLEKENTERSRTVVLTFDLSLIQIIKVSDQGLLSLIFQIIFIAFFSAKGLCSGPILDLYWVQQPHPI